MKIKKSLALFFAGSALAVSSAQAGIVYNNGAYNPANFGAYFSEGSYRVADNFSMSAADTIQSIRFWGGHWSSGVRPAVENFTVYFYGAGFGPGALIGSSALKMYSTVDTGFDHNNFSGADILEFSGNLINPIALGAGSYWVSVVSQDNPGTDFFWQETGTDSAPAVWAQSGNGGASWSTYSSGGEKAFYLADTRFGQQVPEPASLALASLGLAGLGWSRRRKAAQAD